MRRQRDSPSMLFYRRDLGIPGEPHTGEWHGPTVATLRNLLLKAELPDEWELWPNQWGNFAIYQMGESIQRPGEEMRWYIGYIDLHTGEVHVKPGVRPVMGHAEVEQSPPGTAPGWPEQSNLPHNVGHRHNTVQGGEDQSVIHESWIDAARRD